MERGYGWERTVVAKLNKVAERGTAVMQLSFCFLVADIWDVSYTHPFCLLSFCLFLDKLLQRNQMFIINANHYKMNVLALNLR